MPDSKTKATDNQDTSPYYFPDENVVIHAKDIEEARKLLKKQLSGDKEDK